VVNLIFIAKSAPGTPSFVIEQLTVAEQELDRVAQITRKTLGFYRESIAPERIEIPTLIDSVLDIYSNKLAEKNIKVERTFDECPPVRAVPGELKQVLSNLISNAIDAVPGGGEVAVSARAVQKGDEIAVEIVVADNGSGIPPAHIERIFEPFFTTKKDVGTGLGLWVTKEIVERYGGTIDVEPRNGADPPVGTAFTVQLPSAPELDGVQPYQNHAEN
jgi:signal transduction histidine kinase